MGKASGRNNSAAASKPAALHWDGSGADPAAPITQLAGRYVQYLLANDDQLPSNGAGEAAVGC
jgi:hypothetical protein